MDIYIKELETHLGGIVAHCNEEVQGVRGNRPNPQLIESVPVEAYGQKLTVREVGSISVQLPRTLEVNVWDKSIIGTVAKAIADAKGGLSVSNDSTAVRVTLPTLTDERRAEFIKLVKKISEEARIQIRNARDEVMKKIKAAQDRKELTEDAVFKGKERLQKAVDAANSKIESAVQAKVSEISE